MASLIRPDICPEANHTRWDYYFNCLNKLKKTVKYDE